MTTTLRVPTFIRLALTGLVLAWPAAASAQTCPEPASLTAGMTQPMAAVRYLADDALAGRRAGTDGERCAGDYIAAQFARVGLKPAGDAGTFFQSLELRSALNPHASGGTGRNVIAAIEGADEARKREWVVIGAHYDHLGEGGMPGSRVPGEQAIHNGADDNASGVGALLRIAERLAAGPRPARSVLFIAFTGEESGLLGSAHFVANPTIGADSMVAMINLDMVGRLGDQALIIYGVETAAEWNGLIAPAADRVGVPIATRREGYGPSDHTSFYLKDIPVLHFFTNTHTDYHHPNDDWEKIDAVGLANIAAIVSDIASDVANRSQVLTLQRGAGEPPRQMASGSTSYLGTVPDFSPVERGVKLSGVTPGSPGALAGIQAGDVIVAIGTHDVADLQGMTDALRAYKPGETVDVQIVRGEERLTLRATLGSRAAR